MKEPSAQPNQLGWWLYFFAMIAMAIWGIGNTLLIIQYGLFSPAYLSLYMASGIVDVIAIIGLYGYLSGRQFLNGLFWSAVLILEILKLALALFAFLSEISLYMHNESIVAPLLGVLGVILAVPLIVALRRYAVGFA